MEKIIKNNVLIIAGFLILAVVIVFGGYVYKTVPAVRNAVMLATTVQPETFTELYFNDHLKLPSTVKTGDKYSFEFTVHNLEYKTIKYPYEVYVSVNSVKQNVDKNIFSLKQNEYKIIKENFTVNVATRSAVVINLINKKQQIDFWVEGVQ
jgi:hypothetical protein